MSFRTPETLTAVHRMRLLQQQGKLLMAGKNHKPSKAHQKALEQARSALRASTAAQTNATAVIDPKLDMDGSFLILPIDEIEPYEHNPRTGLNPNYETIKESIRADGITNMLSVTRRNPASKYTIYGGGNTRLQIAKELYLEGDERFAQLHVVYKEWPGDAQVITAHLVENENRGDISFWEKAQGVEAFKREYELEQGTVLTAGALNRELRQRGLNYGVKTLQNFAFAVENFVPIGPWLNARFLNETLRPVYALLESLGSRLDGSPTPAREAMFAAMEEIGRHLEETDDANRDLDPQDRQAVELDENALVDALHEAVASQQETSRALLEEMLRVLQANPKIDADALRQVDEEPVLPPQQEPSSSKAQNFRLASQPPLGPMLGSVPAPAVTEGETSVENRKANGAGQLSETGGPRPSETKADVAAQLGALIRQELMKLAQNAPIHDLLLFSDALPFFFAVDLPANPKAFTTYQGGDLNPEDGRLRGALWRFLAAFSLQFDARVATLIGEMKDTHWAAASRGGLESFRKACEQCTGLKVDVQGQPMSAMADIARILHRPDVSYPFMRIVGYSMEMRLRSPEQVPQPFQSVFNSPNSPSS